MADTFIALTNKQYQRKILINVAQIIYLEPGATTGTIVGVAPISSPQIEVTNCKHCGLPEKKHLGPRQWCPRGQQGRISLTAYSPHDTPIPPSGKAA